MDTTYSILLGSGDLFDGKSVVEKAVAWEVLANIRLDKLNALIRVVDALDLVANTAN